MTGKGDMSCDMQSTLDYDTLFGGPTIHLSIHPSEGVTEAFGAITRFWDWLSKQYLSCGWQLLCFALLGGLSNPAYGVSLLVERKGVDGQIVAVFAQFVWWVGLPEFVCVYTFP